jgi:hypothetical protein
MLEIMEASSHEVRTMLNEPKDADALRATILETQVNAALSGHDLGPDERVDNEAGGHEARCRIGNCNPKPGRYQLSDLLFVGAQVIKVGRHVEILL